MYDTLVADVNAYPQTVNWVSLLKKVLNENGLGYFWNMQNELVEEKLMYLNIFKDRLQDMHLQTFDSELRNVSDNRLYKHIEHDFYGKDYLNKIKHNHLRIALSRLRLGSHNFMVERGRWKRPKVPFTHRLCRECDMIEDEFHIFFECNRYANLRKKYLPSSVIDKPSMFKFIELLQKSHDNQVLQLAIFIYKVFKHYDDNEI